MPKLDDAAQRFAQICEASLDAVPTLQAFLAERTAPRRHRKAATAGAAPARLSGRYINTYPVLNAADFAAVMKHVGQRVELVGKIVLVNAGVGTGLRHGRPYLQVGFSRHWRNTVRFTVWSNTKELSLALGQEWVGRWVSAVGLIGQPFVTDAFLVPRTRVGIVLDDPSQMNFISVEQAEYRLAPPAAASRTPKEAAAAPHGPAADGSPPLHNRQIVAQFRNQTPVAPAPAAPVRQAATAPRPLPANPNGALVSRLRSMPPIAKPAATRVPPPPRAPIRPRTGRSPVMVLHPRRQGTPPEPPPPASELLPPTWAEVVLRKLGLRD
jgi:hypothetical protein